MAGDLGAFPAVAELGERRFGVGEGDLVEPASVSRAPIEAGPARERRTRLAAIAPAGQIDIALGRQLGHAHADPQATQVPFQRILGRARRFGEQHARQGCQAHPKQTADHFEISHPIPVASYDASIGRAAPPSQPQDRLSRMARRIGRCQG